MSTRKKAERDKSNDMKVWQQKSLATAALNENHERVISTSPLKYRPNIDYDGFPYV